MLSLHLQRVRHFSASSAGIRCLLLLAASALWSCGGVTNPTLSPDFDFAGTIPRAGNMMTFHRFTVPRGGTLTATVEWATPQGHQSVCIVRSDIADLPATCATALAGRSNSVTVSVIAGDPYVVYGSPDFSADAAYTIAVRVR